MKKMYELDKQNFGEIMSANFAVDGNIIMLPNKNRIFPYFEFSIKGEREKIIWVLQEYEGADSYRYRGGESFSVIDLFGSLEEAIKAWASIEQKRQEVR